MVFDKILNKEILRLAVPSILANITVPLVGMVDTAVAGHIEGESAMFIGAISVGAVFFSLLYWSFSFLRSGTGGLTAQAYGRGDMRECGRIMLRACLMAIAVAVVVLACQLPFMRLVSLIIDSTPQVLELAQRYFMIRVWAAPATLSLMSFRGFFVGMQDSVSSMWTDLIINVVNIAASVALAFGFGSWEGIGFDGIALGTVIAQYCGMLFCIVRCATKYRKVLEAVGLVAGSGAQRRAGQVKSLLAEVLDRSKMGEFFKMNANLLLRSLAFMGIYAGYTLIAAKFGDLYLSCSSIMMQLLMLFSYFTDGFAYAGEALTGRFIGAGESASMRRGVKYVFAWSMAITLVFMVFYSLSGYWILSLMTSDSAVLGACSNYLPWLILMPPLGCAAFTWDGVFLGATDSKALRDSMWWSVVAFFALWFVGKRWIGIESTSAQAELSLHLLLAAYFSHLVARTIYLTIRYFCRLRRRV